MRSFFFNFRFKYRKIQPFSLISLNENILNKTFFSFAALLASGVFTYSYIREWIGIKFLGEKINLQSGNPEAPYFHASENLYLTNTLIFGLLFLAIFILAVYASWKKKEGLVFLSFVLSMLCIFLTMVNGAIK